MICKICNTEMSIISHNKEDQIESYGCDICGEIFKKKYSTEIKKYTTDQYLIDSKRTANLSPTIMKRLQAENMLDLLHACFVLTTETGELVDQLKKHIFYSNELDVTNLKEELGDILWYFALILRNYNWTFEEVMEINTNKLKARYPEKFTEDKATNRDLDKEREILEDDLSWMNQAKINERSPLSGKIQERINIDKLRVDNRTVVEKLYDNCIEENGEFRSIE